ncbi:MAG: RNA polymerase sigma factor [Deltaproteobacteria bacterium]|nr:RNA polymerase sigma factor [Deltaproteobacteria bacterium]
MQSNDGPDDHGRDPRVDGAGATGNRTAPLDLATVYRLHAQDVARWATGLLGPPWDADDVVQEVFIVVQRQLPSWKPNAKITTWLFEITRRVALAKRRRQRFWGLRNRSMHEDEEFSHKGPGPIELLEKREASQTVYRLLDKLPEKYRVTLLLYEIEERSGPEVAELTGATLENVWVRLHRGRALFKKQFEKSMGSRGGEK